MEFKKRFRPVRILVQSGATTATRAVTVDDTKRVSEVIKDITDQVGLSPAISEDELYNMQEDECMCSGGGGGVGGGVWLITFFKINIISFPHIKDIMLQVYYYYHFSHLHFPHLSFSLCSLPLLFLFVFCYLLLPFSLPQ